MSHKSHDLSNASHAGLLRKAFDHESIEGSLRVDGLTRILDDLGLARDANPDVVQGVWKAMAPIQGKVFWSNFHEVMLSITNAAPTPTHSVASDASEHAASPPPAPPLSPPFAHPSLLNTSALDIPEANSFYAQSVADQPASLGSKLRSEYLYTAPDSYMTQSEKERVKSREDDLREREAQLLVREMQILGNDNPNAGKSRSYNTNATYMNDTSSSVLSSPATGSSPPSARRILANTEHYSRGRRGSYTYGLNSTPLLREASPPREVRDVRDRVGLMGNDDTYVSPNRFFRRRSRSPPAGMRRRSRSRSRSRSPRQRRVLALMETEEERGVVGYHIRTRGELREHENEWRLAIQAMELEGRADIVLWAWRMSQHRWRQGGGTTTVVEVEDTSLREESLRRREQQLEAEGERMMRRVEERERQCESTEARLRSVESLEETVAMQKRKLREAAEANQRHEQDLRDREESLERQQRDMSDSNAHSIAELERKEARAEKAEQRAKDAEQRARDLERKLEQESHERDMKLRDLEATLREREAALRMNEDRRGHEDATLTSREARLAEREKALREQQTEGQVIAALKEQVATLSSKLSTTSTQLEDAEARAASGLLRLQQMEAREELLREGEAQIQAELARLGSLEAGLMQREKDSEKAMVPSAELSRLQAQIHILTSQERKWLEWAEKVRERERHISEEVARFQRSEKDKRAVLEHNMATQRQQLEHWAMQLQTEQANFEQQMHVVNAVPTRLSGDVLEGLGDDFAPNRAPSEDTELVVESAKRLYDKTLRIQTQIDQGLQARKAQETPPANFNYFFNAASPVGQPPQAVAPMPAPPASGAHPTSGWAPPVTPPATRQAQQKQPRQKPQSPAAVPPAHALPSVKQLQEQQQSAPLAPPPPPHHYPEYGDALDIEDPVRAQSGNHSQRSVSLPPLPEPPGPSMTPGSPDFANYIRGYETACPCPLGSIRSEVSHTEMQTRKGWRCSASSSSFGAGGSPTRSLSTEAGTQPAAPPPSTVGDKAANDSWFCTSLDLACTTVQETSAAQRKATTYPLKERTEPPVVGAPLADAQQTYRAIECNMAELELSLMSKESSRANSRTNTPTQSPSDRSAFSGVDDRERRSLRQKASVPRRLKFSDTRPTTPTAKVNLFKTASRDLGCPNGPGGPERTAVPRSGVRAHTTTTMLNLIKVVPPTRHDGPVSPTPKRPITPPQHSVDLSNELVTSSVTRMLQRGVLPDP